MPYRRPRCKFENLAECQLCKLKFRRSKADTSPHFFLHCPDFARSRLKHLRAHTYRYPTKLVGIEIECLSRFVLAFFDLLNQIKEFYFVTSQRTTHNSLSAMPILRTNHRTKLYLVGVYLFYKWKRETPIKRTYL